ncbi:MAG: HAMP domain-containing protein [Anaerolineae bacterium]
MGLLAGALLGWSLSLPIKRLAAATKAVVARDLSYRVEVKGAQEIQELAANFKEMTAVLAHSEQFRQNMMADVSHELLTPLTVLQGNLRAILDDVYELNKDEIARRRQRRWHRSRDAAPHF